jgi:hypothetical protein
MIKNARNPYSSFRRPYNDEHPIPIPKMVDLSDNEEVELFIGGLFDNPIPTTTPGTDSTSGGTDWNKVFDTINKAAATVGTVLEATRDKSSGYNPQPTGGNFIPDNSGSDQKQDPNIKLYIIIGAVLFSILLLIVLIKAIKK